MTSLSEFGFVSVLNICDWDGYISLADIAIN
jgi:hypothetical protein